LLTISPYAGRFWKCGQESPFAPEVFEGLGRYPVQEEDGSSPLKIKILLKKRSSLELRSKTHVCNESSVNK